MRRRQVGVRTATAWCVVATLVAGALSWAVFAGNDGDSAMAAANAGRWRPAAPGWAWSFPRDHYAHFGHRTEWWYLTGHLVEVGAPPGTEPLPFQFTLFRVGLSPQAPSPDASAWRASALVMGHAAVTDPAGGTRVFSEVLWRAAAGLGGFGSPGDSTLAWCLAPPGTPGTWAIAICGDDFSVRARDDRRGLAFSLRCAPLTPVVLQGPGGFSPKNADGTAGSLYYSLPRLSVSGTLRRGDRDVAVSGQAWLDREIFTSTLAPAQTGWDWVSLQLDDGRSLMLYRLRRADGGIDFALGSLIAPDGAVTALTADAWSLEPLATWTSARSGDTYPVSWRLRVPDAALDAELRAVVDDQENLSERTGVRYWEGGVRATLPGAGAGGVAIGRGFVELTGYGKDGRPPV